MEWARDDLFIRSFSSNLLDFFVQLEDQAAEGRLTSSSCGRLGDRRDPDTSDDSPRACGARLGLEIPLFPPQLGNGKFLGAWKLFTSYIYSHKKEHANRGVNKISQLVKILADVAAALMLWPSRLPSLKFAMKMLLLWSIAALSTSSGVNGTNCHSKVGTKAAFSSKGRLTRLWWWKRSLRKYSLERLLQKYFIQDQNLFRSKGVPVQDRVFQYLSKHINLDLFDEFSTWNFHLTFINFYFKI